MVYSDKNSGIVTFDLKYGSIVGQKYPLQTLEYFATFELRYCKKILYLKIVNFYGNGTVLAVQSWKEKSWFAVV